MRETAFRTHTDKQVLICVTMLLLIVNFIVRPCILIVVYVFLLLSMYSYCSPMYSYRCLCILIVVYVFLLFVHVFLLLSIYSYCSSMYSYCCLCILIVVYVFLLFVHVFLLLSMYTYCCLCILRRGYLD
jgi:hypothetical protein